MPLPVSTASCLEKVQDRGNGGFGACGAKEEDKGSGRVRRSLLMEGVGTTVGEKTVGAAGHGSGAFSMRCKSLERLEWSGATALLLLLGAVLPLYIPVHFLFSIAFHGLS